jgi:hypothetical protein
MTPARPSHRATVVMSSSVARKVSRSAADGMPEVAAALARESTSSLPRRSSAEIATPIWAVAVCAGIQLTTRSSSSSLLVPSPSPMAPNTARHASAVICLASVAKVRPRACTWAAAKQSVRNREAPKEAVAARARAITSAVLTDLVHDGGTPCAAATRRPLAKAEKAQPYDAVNGSFPPQREPSG